MARHHLLAWGAPRLSVGLTGRPQDAHLSRTVSETCPKEIGRMADLLLPDPSKAVHIPTFDDLARSGIYFLLHEGVVVYVGKAVDMRRRVGQHISEGTKIFDAVSYVPSPIGRLDELERRYIEKLVPKHNQCRLSALLRSTGADAQAEPLVGVTKTIRRGRNRRRVAVSVLA